MTGALRKEIEHWRFLDSWKGCLTWLNEKHVVVNISSHSLDFGWGGFIVPPGMWPLEARDYWSSDTRSLPIVVKEALAFVNTLQAGKPLVTNAREDAHTDNRDFKIQDATASRTRWLINGLGLERRRLSGKSKVKTPFGCKTTRLRNALHQCDSSAFL